MKTVLSPSANSLRFGLIGNPENRRVQDFQAAVEALGHPRPACLAYEELLGDPSSLDRFDVDWIRIDSPGENPAVAEALILRGGGCPDVPLAFGEIGFQREYHRGFCDVLEQIAARGIPCVNAPQDIAVMFDKWQCHQRFVDHEIARPHSEMAPASFLVLREHMRARGSGRDFLKPLHGSSASGVCALRWTPHHQQLIAPLRIQIEKGRTLLINSLEVRTYTHPADIQAILERLLPSGMIQERWIPKLSLPEGAVDLRVLVIHGEPRHWVVRQSMYPMTNLHLGNRRGDAAVLRNILGGKLDKAFELAARAAACFSDSLYAGVDILIDSSHRAFVGEINAFGDLLPRLIHRKESAYTAIARACYDRRCLV